LNGGENSVRTFLKLRRALATGGISGLIRLVVARLQHGIPTAELEATSDFDLRYGTQTSGRIDQVDLDTQQFASWVHGFRYQASGAGLVRELCVASAIDPTNYTFLDLGCGKGRMVLEAAEAGFAKAVGVEFSESLLSVARQNADCFRERFGACNVEFHHADASVFVPPPGPLVVFLYNPFGEPLMREVASQLAARERTQKHPLLIWYHNPKYGACWDAVGFSRFAELPKQDTVIWRP
jgi:SAM-dependent methyltransferase